LLKPLRNAEIKRKLQTKNVLKLEKVNENWKKELENWKRIWKIGKREVENWKKEIENWKKEIQNWKNYKYFKNATF